MQTVASRENDRNAAVAHSGSSGQTTNASWIEPAIHRTRGREMRPVRELRLPRRAGVGGGVARERQPRDEAEAEQERRPQEDRAVGEPGEEEEALTKREAERHRDERRPETRVGDRRQVAVEQRPNGSCSASSARRMKAAMPTLMVANAPDPGEA
jgi:hypothetical protein